MSIVASLAQKKDSVSAIKKELDKATITAVVDYRGLSVADLTALRVELLKEEARLTVSKNTLIKRAVAGTDKSDMSELLAGPTALLLGEADQVTPVKILTKFLKENKKKNEIRGGIMDGNFLNAEEMDALSKLPSLDELRGKLVGGLASPLNGIVAALSGPQRGLVNVLDQFAQHKQATEG